MLQFRVDWYRAEERLSRGLVAESARLWRRAKTRWRLAVAIGTVVAAVGLWRVWSRAPDVKARIVLVAMEINGSREALLPMRELQSAVTSTLLPKDKLLALIEANNWYPLRRTHGPEFALSELWDQLEIKVVRNHFLADTDFGAPRSARIQITAVGQDPHATWQLAEGVAEIIAATAAVERDRVAMDMAAELKDAATLVRERVFELQRRTSEASAASDIAEREGKLALAKALRSEALSTRQLVLKARDELIELTEAADQPALLAGLTSAGLGLDFQIAVEERPQPSEGRWLVLLIATLGILIAAGIVGAAIAALVRPVVTDEDDLERLGIARAGVLPAFSGQELGSLHARGLSTERASRVR